MAKTLEEWQEQAQLAQELGDIDAELEAREAIDSWRPESSAGEKVIGGLETGATMLSGMIAEPMAGAAALATLMLSRGDEVGANAVLDAVREKITYKPQTREGMNQLQVVGRTLQPVAEAIETVEKGAGDITYDLTGSPELAAIATAAPAAIMEGLGLGLARKGKQVARAVPDDVSKSVIEASKRFDVPVMTSDVLPPKTYVGKFMQSLSEKLGPLGSGKARASQQVARESAISGLADNLNIDLNSDFAGDIVKSLNKTSAKKLQVAGKTRGEAIIALNKYGEVPLTKTISAIDTQLAKQAKLGARANSQIVKKLEDTKSAIQGGNFEHLKDIRTEVISDLIDIRKGDDTARAEPIMQAIKSAIDDDMKTFASANDRSAAAKWISSNQQFANELDVVKRTELKRILNSGQSTPEQIMPILKGGKPSQLNRLYSSLDDTGREAARKAIIQDALKSSKYFEVDANPNPNAFVNALNKANTQQAVNVFFKGKDKAEIDGLNRLLNATRRAQDASTALRTGEQVILPAAGSAAGVALYADPFAGASAVTAATAIAKAYESKAFRNLLLKLKNTKPGSKAEAGLLELAIPIVSVELRAAKEEQQEKE